MSREDKTPTFEDFKEVPTDPDTIIEVKLPQDALNCLFFLKKYNLKTPENTEKVKLIIFAPHALLRLYSTINCLHYDPFSPPLIQTKFNIYFKRAYLSIAGAAVALSKFSQELKPNLTDDIAAIIASFLEFNNAVTVAITKKTIYKSAKRTCGDTLFSRLSDRPVQLPHTAKAALLGFGNELKQNLNAVANQVVSFLTFNDALSVAKTKKTIYELTKKESGGALFNWLGSTTAPSSNTDETAKLSK